MAHNEQYLISLVEAIQTLHVYLGEIAMMHATNMRGSMVNGYFIPDIDYGPFMTGIIESVFERPNAALTPLPEERVNFPKACADTLTQWGVPRVRWLWLCMEIFRAVVSACQHFLPNIYYDDPKHSYTYALCNEYDMYFSHTHHD